MKNHVDNISSKLYFKPLALVLLMLITVGAFATLGDGKKKSSVASKKLLSSQTQQFNGSFSLRSGYNFRGNTILEPNQKIVIRINTDVLVGKGHNSFTVPIKGKAIISKLKIELGNRDLRNN